jgi:hypothetical protein
LASGRLLDKVAGTPSTNCIPATPIDAFVGVNPTLAFDCEKARTLDEAIIAASPVVFQLKSSPFGRAPPCSRSAIAASQEAPLHRARYPMHRTDSDRAGLPVGLELSRERGQERGPLLVIDRRAQRAIGPFPRR